MNGHQNGRTANAVRWGAIIGLSLITLEFVCRVEDRIALGIPILSRVRAAEDLVLIDTSGAHGRPNAQFRKWRLNSLGFRSPEVLRTPDAETLRIVVHGASETFGLYESPQQEYPRQLEDSIRAILGRKCSNWTRRVEVLNAALPGMTLPTLTRNLETDVLPLKPDVIVLYPNPSFYMDERPPRASRTRFATDSALPVTNVFHPRAVARVRDQLKSLVPAPVLTAMRRLFVDARRRRVSDSVLWTDAPPERLALFEADLRRAVGVARSHGAEVVLMAHVNATMVPGRRPDALIVAWEKQAPHASGAALMRFDSLSVAVTRLVATDSAAVLVDLPAFADALGPTAFADFVHFTDLGAAKVASILSASLLDELNRRGANCSSLP